VAPPILNLGIRWRLVVRLTFRPLYSLGKHAQFLPKRKLGGCRRPFGCFGKERIVFTLRESNRDSPVVQPVAWSL
jgi:hypothetical protein